MDTPYTPPTSRPASYDGAMLGTLRLSEVVAAMTYALDITEGQPEGHALRSCLIGMAVGAELGLGTQDLSDLYYALLLKDLGCSSNAAKLRHIFGADDFQVKRAFKTVNLDNLREGTPFVLANAGERRTAPPAAQTRDRREFGAARRAHRADASTLRTWGRHRAADGFF